MFFVNGISKSFGSQQVLHNIKFEVNKGQCVALLGINGSGKSTLLNILSGNIKADSGSYGSHEPLKIAFLPQDNPLLSELSAMDNIKLWYPGSTKEIMCEKNKLLFHRLGVDSFLNKRVSKLSGGMKKRLSLAITMMSEPELLLLDEPLASLDILCKNGILDYLRSYTKNGGTVIVATHESSVLDICSHIYTLKNGELKLAVDNTASGISQRPDESYYSRLLLEN